MQSVILGTAQWGLDYGATNRAGRLDDAAVAGLVDVALARGIAALDTAPAYGDAETRIGVLVPQFAVQTKVSVGKGAAGGVRDSVLVSLTRLRRNRLRAVLVHDWSAADDDRRSEAAHELEALRSEGRIDAVGVSAYDEDDVDSALGAFGTLDIVQVPVSVLDQRLVGSRVLGQLRNQGGRVQGRSVLLQGAALADPDHPRFGAHPDVARLRAAGDPLALCLGFVSSLDWVDEVVLAATTAAELSEVMAALAAPVTSVDWPTLASRDPWLVDPRRWSEPTAAG